MESRVDNAPATRLWLLPDLAFAAMALSWLSLSLSSLESQLGNTASCCMRLGSAYSPVLDTGVEG